MVALETGYQFLRSLEFCENSHCSLDLRQQMHFFSLMSEMSRSEKRSEFADKEDGKIVEGVEEEEVVSSKNIFKQVNTTPQLQAQAPASSFFRFTVNLSAEALNEIIH